MVLTRNQSKELNKELFKIVGLDIGRNECGQEINEIQKQQYIERKYEDIDSLLRKGADIDFVMGGKSIIMHFIETINKTYGKNDSDLKKSEQNHILNLLLTEEEVDVNCIDKNGNTVLMLATKYNLYGVVRTLLENSDAEISINDINDQGINPLIQAYLYQNQQIIDLLISRGGNCINGLSYYINNVYISQEQFNLATQYLNELLSSESPSSNYYESEYLNTSFYNTDTVSDDYSVLVGILEIE